MIEIEIPANWTDKDIEKFQQTLNMRRTKKQEKHCGNCDHSADNGTRCLLMSCGCITAVSNNEEPTRWMEIPHTPPQV